MNNQTFSLEVIQSQIVRINAKVQQAIQHPNPDYLNLANLHAELSRLQRRAANAYLELAGLGSSLTPNPTEES